MRLPQALLLTLLLALGARSAPISDHPDNSMQAQQFESALKGAGIPTKVFGAREPNHSCIKSKLRLPEDSTTKALFEFVVEALKK